MAMVATTFTRRCSIALLAALLVFAQISMAAQGCLLAFDRAPQAHDAAMAEERCGSVPMEGAVCMMHCLGQDQSVSTPEHHFTAIAAVPTIKPLDFALAASSGPARVLSDSRLHVPRPPQILFCSYQT